MQELIEWCNSCLTDKTMSDGGRIALEVTIVRATDLLEREKEQIDKAYYQGIYDKNEGLIKEEYYHETYNPSIKKITITELTTQKQHIIDIMEEDENDGLYSPV